MQTPATKVPIYIGAVQGKGPISTVIKWFQWGDPNTHVFYLRPLANGKYLVTEAWHLPLLRGGAVRSYEVDTPYFLKDEAIEYHKVMVTPRQKRRFDGFLDHIVEKKSKYDYFGILGFVTRDPRTNSLRRWFCSEILVAGLAKVGVYLFNNTLPQSVSPAMTLRSPLLKSHKFLV